MAKLRIKQPLSVGGIEHMIRKLDTWERKMPQVQAEFRRRSLNYLEQRAKAHIKATTGGSSWYQLTHTLENSFEKDVALGELINTCYYSAWVEFGTGIVGEGTHPNDMGYQYNLNEYFDGWWFMYEGESHFTSGMEAHRFMYNAVQDYINGEYKKIYNASFKTVMRGVLK